MDLLTVGESFDDVIFAGLPRVPRLGEELRVSSISTHPGGGAVITAVAAARLGLGTGVLSALSAANVLRLRPEHVAITNLRRPAEAGAITVALSTKRDRAFVTFDGVNRVLEPRLLARLRALARRPRHVHFALGPRRCARWIPIVNRLRSSGATTSWDFGWNETLVRDAGLPRLLAAVDCVFVNEREATLYGRVGTLRASIDRWRTLARQAVIKLGPRGAIVVEGRDTHQQSAPRVVAVDTTGAGDAFNAGFLAARLAHRSMDDALRLANHVGAQSTRTAGGLDGLPYRDRLPAWALRLLEAA